MFRKMRRNTMPSAKFASRGFTLIASLLLTLLLSGFADRSAHDGQHRAEGRRGRSQQQLHVSCRRRRHGKDDFRPGQHFQNIQAPTAAQICAVSNNPPTWDPTVSFTGAAGAYNVTPVTPGAAIPALRRSLRFGALFSRARYAGLYAQIIPVTHERHGATEFSATPRPSA